MVPIPKPQAQPLWICIHTMKVKLTAPPMQTANKRVLKKVDIALASSGSVSSNWSAPCDGREAFTPALPKANRYRPMYRRASWPPLGVLQ